jgi:two-component system, OmpR family, KDP operon response regulator KdpE
LAARGPSVLVIDDDPAIRRMLRQVLTAAGYRVQDVAPGQGAVGRIAEREFDLLILDIDQPAGNGPELIQIMRNLSPAPILALSVRDDESAAVSALENGADDYVRKPFGLNELLARVMTALRRRARERGKPPVVVTGDLEIDLLHRRIRLHGQEIHLSVKLYEVLRVLAENAGRVQTHEEILRTVWGSHSAERVEYVRVAIRKLRRQLEADPTDPRYLLTEPGIGYRLEVRKGDNADRSSRSQRGAVSS